MKRRFRCAPEWYCWRWRVWHWDLRRSSSFRRWAEWNGQYRDGVRRYWKGDKGLYVINDIPLEDYVKGVVAAEMKSSWGCMEDNRAFQSLSL